MVSTQDQSAQPPSPTSVPPPVPARPTDQYFIQPRYSPYGPVNPYGMASSPFIGIGAHQGPYSMQTFANSSQQIDATFRSIQSIVQAFSSISMMLESTYMAVHSSFRAVMDVADHFIRLKDNLSGVLSLVTIFNTIKWFFRRLLHMFNIVSEDEIWSESLAKATSTVAKGQQSIFEQGRSQSSWPMLMFLSVALGAPYMIYQLQKPAAASSKWLLQEDSHYIGEALYDFNAAQETEIPLKAGQRVIIAPKEQQPRVTDWLLATTDGKKAGLVPMNYVKIIKFEIIE